MSEDAVRAYASGKHFGAASVGRWLAHDEAGRLALLAVAERLRLGENQLRDILEAAEDVAARQGSGIAAVLTGNEVTAALSADVGRNEAIKAVKNALRRQRYPQLSAAEGRLKGLVGRLGLPAGATAELPQNLEGEDLTVTLRARSAAELRARAASLVAALNGSEVDEIFAILGGEW
jgi:hypothetical protein